MTGKSLRKNDLMIALNILHTKNEKNISCQRFKT